MYCYPATTKGFLIGFLYLSLSVGCGESVEEETEFAPDVVLPEKMKPIEPKLAEVGVGAQGQSLKNDTQLERIITQPAITLFQTKEKVAFEILIPQSLQFFQASNGRLPNSHEEFMQKVIKEQNIKLPVLPAGQVYRYHTDDGQLWVEPVEGSTQSDS
jgi:hypothetical protein